MKEEVEKLRRDLTLYSGSFNSFSKYSHTSSTDQYNMYGTVPFLRSLILDFSKSLKLKLSPLAMAIFKTLEKLF